MCRQTVIPGGTAAAFPAFLTSIPPASSLIRQVYFKGVKSFNVSCSFSSDGNSKHRKPPPPRSPRIKLSAEDTKVTRIVKNSIKASLSTEDLEDTRLLKKKKEKRNGKRKAAARSPLRCCQVL